MPDHRILKASETGDFFRQRAKPLIRLQGRWLERAGIPAGCLVAVEVIAEGIIEIRRLTPDSSADQPDPPAPVEPAYTKRALRSHRPLTK